MLLWTASGRDAAGRVVYRITGFDLRTGQQRVIATSPPYARSTPAAQRTYFIDARLCGSTAAFLRVTRTRGDVWVADLRTGHLRAISHTGHASEAVITGPWVAWHESGANAIGPVRVADLRTGAVRTVAQGPSYDLSAADGFLTWMDYATGRYTVLDLLMGQRSTPPPQPLASRDQPSSTPTTIHMTGNVGIETAVQNGGVTARSVYLTRILVYPTRDLPSPPSF